MPGMSKLDAVNACLAAVNEYRVTSLDTNGTSIAGEAERYVDDAARYVCAQGFPCNTRRAVSFSGAASTPFEISIASASPEILRVKPVGPSAHRNLVIRGDKFYDADRSTTNFQGQTVFMDVAELLPFVDLDPMLKEMTVKYAAQQFARRTTQSQLADAYISQELAATELVTPKSPTFGATFPIFSPQQQPQQRQGQ
jgi:hypothetical protein